MNQNLLTLQHQNMLRPLGNGRALRVAGANQAG